MSEKRIAFRRRSPVGGSFFVMIQPLHMQRPDTSKVTSALMPRRAGESMESRAVP